jgi:hypothetical protein
MQNLVGLRKIECSSILIKSKERHSSTSRAHRIIFCDCRCRKSRRKPELPTVGSHDSCRKCWLPVTACAVTVDVGSPDVSRNFRQSEVPTQAGSPGIDGFTDLLTVPVGSPDDRRKFRQSEVPTFVGSSDADLQPWTFDLAWTVFSSYVGSPEICVGTSDVDLNG